MQRLELQHEANFVYSALLLEMITPLLDLLDIGASNYPPPVCWVGCVGWVGWVGNPLRHDCAHQRSPSRALNRRAASNASDHSITGSLRSTRPLADESHSRASLPSFAPISLLPRLSFRRLSSPAHFSANRAPSRACALFWCCRPFHPLVALVQPPHLAHNRIRAPRR